ncbi:MAG: ABC transporter permease [Methanotrichaceae archaeon]|nr:ABC transporter permease [Methanotrichaceae archaeon]
MPNGSTTALESTMVLRHITYRKGQTALSVTAICLAVAISIIMISIQNGFQSFLFNIVFKNLPHITIQPHEGEDYLHLFRGIAENVWSIPGIIGVSPILGTSTTIAYKENVENVAMIGIIPLEANKISSLSENMVQGGIDSVLGGNRMIIGQALANKLKVKKGDTVQVSFPDATTLNLVIAGIFNTGYEFLDEGITYISLDTARSFLGKGDVVTEIDIKLEDPFQADTLVRQFRNQGYNAKGWQELFPEIVRTLAFEKTQNFITMLLLMIIATFGIASIMNMLVLEKTSEIGMLIAMGATTGSVRRLFLMESGVLGLIGSSLGCVLGFIVSTQLGKIVIDTPMGTSMNLPVQLNVMDFILFTILALILSIAAGTYPAHRAATLDPVVALKG